MNFYEWFKIEEATGIIVDPYEAMQELNLTDLAGGILDQENLNKAYRRMQMIHHPDVQGSEEKSKRINSAREVLEKFVGRTLPKNAGEYPNSSQGSSGSYGSGSYGSGSYGSGSYGSYREKEPSDRKHYSEEDVKSWCQQIVDKNYLQLVIRDLLRWLPMNTVFGGFNGPIGSQVKTEKLNKKGKSVNSESILSEIKGYMNYDGSNFPKDIYDMQINENWKEAWITYKAAKGYRSVSFKEIKAPIKKDPNVGMSIDKVESYLLGYGKDLVRLGGEYIGYPEQRDGRTFIGVMVKLQPKVLNIVKRYRTEMYGQSKIEEIKLTSGSHYGQITPDYLNKVINALEKRRGIKDEDI
jgi:curved DNA-binding protein CbpA